MAEQSGRHPSTQQLLRWFEFAHLPPDLQRVSEVCAAAARTAVEMLSDGPELSAGLRKLLEAKDCLVRQAIADRPAAEPVVVRPPDPDLEIPATYVSQGGQTVTLNGDPLVPGGAPRPRVGDTPQA